MFLGESNLMQIYGNFEGLSYNNALFGLLIWWPLYLQTVRFSFFFVWCRSCCGCFNFGGGNGWWKSQERTDSIIQSRFFSLWKSLADCVSVILKCQDFARHIRLSDCEKVLRRTSSPCHWKPPPKGCVSPVGSPARTSPVGNWSQTILQEVHLVSRAYPPWN